MIDASLRLRRAIYLQDLVLVQRIVKANPQIVRNPDLSDKVNTSLHLAATLGAVDIAEFLISAGHEDEQISRNVDKKTPLMSAVETGHEDTAQLIAAHFPRCIGWRDKEGMDAVMKAARTGSPSLITAFLTLSEDPAALVAATDNDGSTALHFASANGYMKCVVTLLQAGANPSARNAFSWAPVSYSSTVSFDVEFRALVTEIEKRRGEEREREREMDRRREGGVRIVGEDSWSSGSDGRDVMRDVLVAGESGRMGTPALRAQGWGTSGRVRAGSSEG